MAYRIPDEETVSKTIISVMIRHPHVETQTELTELVCKELSKKDSGYRISGERIRRIGIDNKIIKISIEYHETDIRTLPDICPVCRNEMAPVKNMSLDGDVVEVRRKCTACPYSVGNRLLIPGRYVFSRANVSEPSEKDIRIKKLRQAKRKLKDASALIDEAVKGTSSEGRGKYTISSISEISDNEEDPGSLKNIILEIKDEKSNDPVWTRPIVSVKNEHRKDI